MKRSMMFASALMFVLSSCFVFAEEEQPVMTPVVCERCSLEEENSDKVLSAQEETLKANLLPKPEDLEEEKAAS